jgi:hypothetical protein
MSKNLSTVWKKRKKEEKGVNIPLSTCITVGAPARTHFSTPHFLTLENRLNT